MSYIDAKSFSIFIEPRQCKYEYHNSHGDKTPLTLQSFQIVSPEVSIFPALLHASYDVLSFLADKYKALNNVAQKYSVKTSSE